MFCRIFLLLLAVQSSRIVPIANASTVQEDLNVKLSKHVSNYNLGTFTLVGALIRVSSDLQIPMGIAWVNTPAARAELPFAWKDATVRELIESIAMTQPGYRVE